MNREKCIQAGIDYDQGVNRFMGNTGLYEKFALKFLDDPTFAKLQEALDAKDVEEGFNMAHTLKGVAGNLSFNTFLDAVIPVVEALRSKNMDLALELFPQAKSEYERLMAALEEQK